MASKPFQNCLEPLSHAGLKGPDLQVIRTVAQARQAMMDEPKRWRAALCTSQTAPMTEDASVTLYATKKGAQDALRTFLSDSKAAGYVLTSGNLGRGYCVLQLENDTRAAALDYRGRRSR